MNLLLLRGNIGKPGAGASPIRGHSNVQGDRTMGIWEQMPPAFLDALQKEFDFDPPREHGFDAVQAIEAMLAGKTKVWIAMGGNLVSAISDTRAAEAAIRKLELNVQISTKLNRNHLTVGDEALILPTLGRTEIDMQESGRADRVGRGLRLRGPRDAGQGHADVRPAAVRGLDRRAASRGSCRRCPDDRLGRVRGELRHHPRPHRARRQGLRQLQRAAQEGQRLHPASRPARLAHLHHPDGQGDDHGQRARVHRVPSRATDAADDAGARPVQHHDLQPERPLPRASRRAARSSSSTRTTWRRSVS